MTIQCGTLAAIVIRFRFKVPKRDARGLYLFIFVVMTKLFAVGFPRTLDEMQLAQLFAPYGDIELLTIVRDKLTLESKGFGFIHMKTENGAQEAIGVLNGTTFGDRQMEVRLAEDKEPEPARPPYKPVPKTSTATQKKKRPRLQR